MKTKIGLLCAALVLSATLTACGSKQEAKPGSSTEGAKTSEKPYELVAAFPGSDQKDMQAVVDEINKYIQPKINATIKLMPIGLGAWSQQTNVMLTANEKLDLLVTGVKLGYTAEVSKGQLLELDDLLKTNGKDISKALEPTYLNAGKVNGKMYGIPTIRDLASASGIMMRKDLVDKYKIDVTKIKTLDDLEPVLKTIKDNEPNIAPLVPYNPGFSFLDNYLTWDKLGDTLGVLPNFGENLKVTNLYETPEYAALLKKFRGWYTAGYIMKDAMTNKESANALVKAGRAFAYTVSMKPGIEAQESRVIGTPMVSVQLTNPFSSTDRVGTIMWGIPRNAKNPEKSMQFLNLMYSDKELVNLIDWGIEGKHYVKKADGLIDFPAGVDAKTSGYNMGNGYIFGNQFLSYVFNGDDPKLWSNMADFNKQSVKSKALGFMYDPTSVKTEVAAVSTVLNQYKVALETGTLDPDSTSPEFISKLKTSGIEKIIAEKQKQLDAWANVK